MGIKGLGAWLRKETPDAIHTVPFKSFSGQRLAIDASIYLYKFICVSNAMRGNYFDMFLNFILWFRVNNVRPVFVFDGKPPPQKDRTKAERRANKAKLENKVMEYEELIERLQELHKNDDIPEELETRIDSALENENLKCSEEPRRKILSKLNEKYKKTSSQCINITPKDTQNIKDLLTYLGLPWIQSEYEAEKTCSWLCNHDYVRGVVTADSDVLAYGVKLWVSDVKAYSDECKIIRYEDVLSSSGLTNTEFTDFCIMCGTDYNSNIPGIGPAKAYRLIQEHSSLDTISLTNLDTEILFYEDARGLFTLPDDIPDHRIKNITGLDEKNLQMLLFKCNSRATVESIKKKVYTPKFKISE